MVERRRFARYDCSYDVDYYTYGVVSVEGRSVAEDISRGGMRLAVSRVIKKGDVLKMNIHSSSKECSIFARGRVRWVQKTKESLPLSVHAGVEFISIEPDDVNKLLHFVE